MLNKIVKELKDTEHEANKILENANEEAQKMILREKNQQKIYQDKAIEEFNTKGKNMVEERVKQARNKAKEIYENSKKDKENLRESLKNKYDKAIEMILNDLVN